MKIVYATGNPAKFRTMESYLEGTGLGFELVSLEQTGRAFHEPEENGRFPLDNARQKAEYYYSVLRQPVFSCDSGLIIEGLSPEEQPGVHVRTVGGRRLSDPQMTAYYAGIARRFGGKCVARYQNAICLILNDKEKYEYDGEDISGGRFWLVDKPMRQVEEGFPLDCISVDMNTGKYITQEDGIAGIQEEAMGFRRFFENVWKRVYGRNL